MNRQEVVLILQIGSLGDTVVALPCYREIARRHPRATRYLLTNFPIGSKMVPAQAILMPTEVIDGSIDYPMPLRGVGAILRLRRQIAALRPTILYYLLPETRLLNLLRHYAFFKLCGIPRIRGVPWSRDSRFPRELAGGLWESEASRLLRNIGVAPGPPSEADRDLALSDAERRTASDALLPLAAQRFVAISVGGKVPINDWGDANWAKVLAELSRAQPGLGAVLVGSADERPRNERLALHWSGPRLNTCGMLSPRETAALLARARVFVGHDTGTLHLAAAAGTPVVGVFSARNVPGKWFSDRPSDTQFYHRVACFGCELTRIEDCPHERMCMTAHDPHKVVAAIQRMLAGTAVGPAIGAAPSVQGAG